MENALPVLQVLSIASLAVLMILESLLDVQMELKDVIVSMDILSLPIPALIKAVEMLIQIVRPVPLTQLPLEVSA